MSLRTIMRKTKIKVIYLYIDLDNLMYFLCVKYIKFVIYIDQLKVQNFKYKLAFKSYFIFKQRIIRANMILNLNVNRVVIVKIVFSENSYIQF